MTPETPSFNGPNGRYNICWDCAQRHGIKHKEPHVMGVWVGTCDLCGATHTGLTNAYHDWGLTDVECDVIKRFRCPMCGMECLGTCIGG